MLSFRYSHGKPTTENERYRLVLSRSNRKIDNLKYGHRNALILRTVFRSFNTVYLQWKFNLLQELDINSNILKA